MGSAPHSIGIRARRSLTTKEQSMSTHAVPGKDSTASASVPSVDMKLEVIVIPVSDVDRAKEFYSRLGWRLDADRTAGSGFRLIQFTPPASGCPVQFGG